MMDVAGSLKISHELGIRKNHAWAGRSKIVAGRVSLHLSPVALSSHGWRLDVSSTCHLKSLHRPISSVTFKRNSFVCQSFLPPVPANEIPILKTAAAAVSRSYNAFSGSPLVQKLVPAISIIAFTVWGLGPLLRQSRNMFLHQTDSNWKKSRTHYVMTSYVQPLLLWAGATLVCRALDPLVLPSEASQAVKQRLLIFARSLSTVLAFAYCLSSLIQQAQKFFVETNNSNDTRNMGFQFAGKAVYTAVWVAAVSLFMELLGFSTQKWLTAGGLGTVLLTLAGREIFTNFLSSAMIHATRPFVANEWIQTKVEGYDVSGTVEHVGWWSPTIIRGEDREAVHIPNHQFTVNVVRNLSQKTHWRIKTHLAISHLDVNKINSIVADMRKVLAKNPQVEQQRLHRRVFLENINPENQALLILISCFVKTSHFEEYLCVKEAILLDLLRVISHHRARLATPIRTVQKIYSDAEVENMPFGETIYGHPRATSNRPLLLIEPSYKINGDDNKSKAQARSARKSEEQEIKVTAASTSVSNKLDGKGAEKSSESKTGTKVPSTSEAAAASTSDTKTEVKVSSRSVSDSKSDPKVSPKSPSEPKGQNPLSDVSVQNNSDKKQPKKDSSGDVRPKSSKIGNVSAETAAPTSPKSQLEGLDPVGRNSKFEAASETSANSSDPASVKAEAIPPATSQPKQESERSTVTPPLTARSPLEENIVLGVALEGSKRTLPIEEEMTQSTTKEEAKELAACHNGNGSSSSSTEDKKESQAPGPAATEIHQER